MRGRESGKVAAEVVSRTDAETLPGFTGDFPEPDATIYINEARAYHRLPNRQTVKHRVGEYVRDMAHTFEGWHNSRPLDTAEQMAAMARGFMGKRLRYADLIA